MVTLTYFSEKYAPDATPFVYFPKSMSQDSFESVESFYRRCQGLLTSHSHSGLKYVERGCGVSRFNLVVQADGAGLMNDLEEEPPKKKIRKRKKIDALRSEFAQLLRQKFSTCPS
jgi:hypothetical protein